MTAFIRLPLRSAQSSQRARWISYAPMQATGTPSDQTVIASLLSASAAPYSGRSISSRMPVCTGCSSSSAKSAGAKRVTETGLTSAAVAGLASCRRRRRSVCRQCRRQSADS